MLRPDEMITAVRPALERSPVAASHDSSIEITVHDHLQQLIEPRKSRVNESSLVCRFVVESR
jgi:hypothetical protein